METPTQKNKGRYYLGKAGLRNAGYEVEMSPEQQAEWIKCSIDPLYFFENYIYIIHVDHGRIKFKPYDFQKNIVNTCVNNRFVICKIPRQQGKCVELNTTVKVRNKKTGHVEEITVGELYAKSKNKDRQDVPELPDDFQG